MNFDKFILQNLQLPLTKIPILHLIHVLILPIPRHILHHIPINLPQRIHNLILNISIQIFINWCFLCFWVIFFYQDLLIDVFQQLFTFTTHNVLLNFEGCFTAMLAWVGRLEVSEDISQEGGHEADFLALVWEVQRVCRYVCCHLLALVVQYADYKHCSIFLLATNLLLQLPTRLHQLLNNSIIPPPPTPNQHNLLSLQLQKYMFNLINTLHQIMSINIAQLSFTVFVFNKPSYSFFFFH